MKSGGGTLWDNRIISAIRSAHIEIVHDAVHDFVAVHVKNMLLNLLTPAKKDS